MDKRTDINTASFAYSVSLLRIRISGYPPGAGTKRQSIHTAVLHGIAVFFCVTEKINPLLCRGRADL